MSKVTPNFLEGMVDSTLKNNTLERKNKRKKKERIQEVKNGKKRVTFVADAELWDKFLSYAYTSRQTITSAMSEMMSEFIEKKNKKLHLYENQKHVEKDLFIKK